MARQSFPSSVTALPTRKKKGYYISISRVCFKYGIFQKITSFSWRWCFTVYAKMRSTQERVKLDCVWRVWDKEQLEEEGLSGRMFESTLLYFSVIWDVNYR